MCYEKRGIKKFISFLLAVCLVASLLIILPESGVLALDAEYTIVIKKGISVSIEGDDIIVKSNPENGIFKGWTIYKQDNTLATQGTDYLLQGFTNLSYSQIHITAKCNLVLSAEYIKIGDLNEDGVVSDKDAIYLLFYSFFPKYYPINQPCDFSGDKKTDDKDAVYLLFYTFFPNLYPLSSGSSTSTGDSGEIEMPWTF